MDAKAEERDTRGFISITTMRPSLGLMENCTLEPPVSTPISRNTANEALRKIWYSLSVKVCAGATVIESPVCTPMGSKFSIEQTMMQLSALSRTTSISYSFQPSKDSSIKSSLVGEASKPRLQIVSNSSELYAIPPPVPPKVKLGRMTVGKPTVRCTAQASSMLCAMPERAEPRPILVIASLNFKRSSALSMASGVAPISSTGLPVAAPVYFCKTPLCHKSKAQFKAVWPPMVGKIASGRSLAMIFSTVCHVMGSM